MGKKNPTSRAGAIYEIPSGNECAKKMRVTGGIRLRTSTVLRLSNPRATETPLIGLQPADRLYQPKTTNLNEP